MKNVLRSICITLALATVLIQSACAPQNENKDDVSKENVTTTSPEKDDYVPEPFDYIPSVAKAAKEARMIYVLNEPDSFSDKLSIAALQGLAANLSDEQILLSNGAYDNYRSYITGKWNCQIKGVVDRKPANLQNLMNHYKDLLDGYILASSDPESESGSVAVSLAGLLNAAIVTPENESLCKNLGMKRLLDVSSKNDAWLRSSEYWNKLNKDIAIEQPLKMAPKLVDYAVMSHAYFSFYNGHNSNEHKEKYSFLNSNGIVFGYNNTLGEYDTVASFSSANLQMIPSDHACNLSTLSGFRRNTLEQKTAEVSGETSKKVHTVCIIMSDGDNVQWMMNNFTTSEKWFANKNRGSFCMGWGLPATAIDLTAPMTEYLYDKMTEKDEFIMQLGGLGYTFPSRWSNAARAEMAKKLAEYMRRTDLHYAEILDDNGMSARALSEFTKQDGIDGLFYIDYSNYAGKNGDIIWSSDKPIVAARYRLWANTSDGSIDAISRAVNRASTDPAKIDSYSFIIVHAWSGMSGIHLAEGGNTMDAVTKLIEAFDDDVDVVTPSEFMSRIIANHAQ